MMPTTISYPAIRQRDNQDTSLTAPVEFKKSSPLINLDIDSHLGKSEILESIFTTKGSHLINETWEKTLNIQSRVMQLNKEFVTCECLIDKEQSIFENRVFPAYLFGHIKNLSVGSYALLSIKSKPGSTRIDVYDGAQLVEKKYFELKADWGDATDFNIPLTWPLKL